jgi:hypothetical protein
MLLHTLEKMLEDAAKSPFSEGLTRREQAVHDYHAKWEKWRVEHADSLSRVRLYSRLKAAKDSGATLLTINPTLKDIGSVIKWSSSRYNLFAKKEVVKSVQQGVLYPSLRNGSVSEWESGCYSAASTGDAGGKLGGRSFGVKNLAYGTYELLMLDGLPYMLVGHKDIITFSNYDYPTLESTFFESVFLSEYNEHEKEREKLQTSSC